MVERIGPGWDAPAPLAMARLGAALLAPTRLYVKPALAAIRAGGVHALAHITGGGLTENLPRVLPDGLGADIDLASWACRRCLLAGKEGGLDQAEMLKTFNAGIGMVLVVAPDQADALRALLVDAGETVHTAWPCVTRGGHAL
jgi:phosphoribosylformylglycinamidine cyclo-ligase